MTRDSIVQIIQQLLNKQVSRGCTEAEAEAAMKKAQQLMIEHNLSLLEVEQAEVEKCNWVTEDAWSGNGQPWDLTFVVDVLQAHFFVKAIFYKGWQRGKRTTRIVLFGDKENVEVARYLLVFLSRTFRQLWQRHRRQGMTSGHASRAFYLGLRDGLNRKLREEREVQLREAKREGALVPVQKALTKAFNDQFKNLRELNSQPVRGSDYDYDCGHDQGRRINIRSAVQEEEGGSRKLLP